MKRYEENFGIDHSKAQKGNNYFPLQAMVELKVVGTCWSLREGRKWREK